VSEAELNRLCKAEFCGYALYALEVVDDLRGNQITILKVLLWETV